MSLCWLFDWQLCDADALLRRFLVFLINDYILRGLVRSYIAWFKNPFKRPSVSARLVWRGRFYLSAVSFYSIDPWLQKDRGQMEGKKKSFKTLNSKLCITVREQFSETQLWILCTKRHLSSKGKKNNLSSGTWARRIFLDYKWHMSLDQDVSRWKLTRSSDCGSGICMQAWQRMAEIKTLQPTISHGAAS